MNLQELQQQKMKILEIATRYGAHNVRVFGSVAQNESDPQSDVDILADFDSDRSLFDMAGFKYELECLLGCEVDVVTENGLRYDVRSKVLKQARAL